MEPEDLIIVINGVDMTESVHSFRFYDAKCDIVYTGSSKVYSYNSCKVQVLKPQGYIEPSSVFVSVDGVEITDIERMIDFGSFYRIVQKGKRPLLYPRSQVVLLRNCLADGASSDLFKYYKQIAASVDLSMKEGSRVLTHQYEEINGVSDETVLASYFFPNDGVPSRTPPSTLIYPFGLNQSQKTAVENAFSSQVSIIQGPPGTGKTQTILNIIANAVRNKKTVAVVSNNNSALANVLEKLEKHNVSFLTAFLGNKENKNYFIENQNGKYPDMSPWVISQEERDAVSVEIKRLTNELNIMLDAKNRIAEIEQELLELKPEQLHFSEYYATYSEPYMWDISKLSSTKILALWLEYELQKEHRNKPGLLQKLFVGFRFGINAIKMFSLSPESVIPYLQSQFYVARQNELVSEKVELERKLADYSFTSKMKDLSQKSLQLFRAELAQNYHWQKSRKIFEYGDFRSKSREFNEEYPVILSTTFSIKDSLNIGYTYDYLIVDEASQVDLATGVLAYSCARNVVIVGDLMQLPNILSKQVVKTDNAIWEQQLFDERYRFSTHSLLSSAVEIWKSAPAVLLREHYRCHPKIINFCNQKFYNGKLIIMTEDHGEPDVLTMFRTVAGNHARGHMNQRQIDVIKQEVLPRLKQYGYRSVGIIAPYNDQITALGKQLKINCETSTVHRFQGREKDAIVLTSVDDVIGKFVDDPRMLNVAVSRAVKSLTVIMSQDPRNDKTSYGDLARYIAYNNCEVIDSAIYSVFDLLYKEYAEQRCLYLLKHKHVSEYDSENLMYLVIQDILKLPEYAKVSCAFHVSLATLVKDYTLLTSEEQTYARNFLTHVDFLLFNKLDKSPIMAVEVDGVSFHQSGSKQSVRDEKKNRILEKCSIPLLRIRTDESGEKVRICEMLNHVLN